MKLTASIKEIQMRSYIENQSNEEILSKIKTLWKDEKLVEIRTLKNQETNIRKCFRTPSDLSLLMICIENEPINYVSEGVRWELRELMEILVFEKGDDVNQICYNKKKCKEQELLTYAFELNKYFSAQILLLGMEYDQRSIAPPGEFFKLIFNQIIKNPIQDKQLERIFNQFVKVSCRSTGLLWLTMKSIKEDKIYISPIQLVLKSITQNHKRIKLILKMCKKMTNKKKYFNLNNDIKKAVIQL